MRGLMSAFQCKVQDGKDGKTESMLPFGVMTRPGGGWWRSVALVKYANRNLLHEC